MTSDRHDYTTRLQHIAETSKSKLARTGVIRAVIRRLTNHSTIHFVLPRNAGYTGVLTATGASGTVSESLRPVLGSNDEFVRTGTGDSGALMARLIYASNMSLDGFTEDDRGAFDWAPPNDDVFTFITELMRSAGTYLYGRHMYETMAVWETDSSLATQSDLTANYAQVWQAADKVVYSSSLAATSTANTRLERHFDPRAVQDMKAAASRDLLVGGPNLAAQAHLAGLVDELQLFVWPVVLRGRKVALPTGMRADLELLDEHRFNNGVVHLRYRLV